MKHRYAYFEALLLAFGALFFFVALYADLPNALYPSSTWEERNGIIRLLLALCGTCIGIASAGSLMAIRYRGRTLSAECLTWVSSLWRETKGTFCRLFPAERTRGVVLWLALIVALGGGIRCFFLAQPMRYDEAYTFLNFVNRGVFHLFSYPVPNNHVLHTLLVRVSVGLFGGHPVAIRLPAFVAGLLVIPMTFSLSRSLGGKETGGFLAAALVAVYPYLILYDTMARGYSLLVFLTLCLVAFGSRMVERPSLGLSFLVALTIALGLFDMPSFLFPVVGVLCWISLALIKRGCTARVLAGVLATCGAMALALTGILYSPVLVVNNGFESIVANPFVRSLSFNEFLTRLPAHLSATAGSFVRDVPVPVLVVFLALFLAGLYATARERRWTELILLPGVAFGSALVLMVKHAIPYDRTWIYFLPLLFFLVDKGAAAMMKRFVANFARAVFFLAVCAAVLVMSRDMISSYQDTGYFPEARVIADVLSGEMGSADRLAALCPADAPTNFYLWYKKVPRRGDPTHGSRTGREFFVVKPSSYSLRDMTSGPARKFFGIGDAELYAAEGKGM